MELDRRNWLCAISLAALALAVRLAFARAVAFPPLDDPAFYLTTATNLVSGRGLEVDVLWSYDILFPSVTHPSHEHWMPLTTWLMAGVFAVLGPSLRAGQVPGILFGTLLAPLTYVVGVRLLRGTKAGASIAAGAGLLVALNATLSYQSASADSSAAFALLAASALAIAEWRRRLAGCAASGVLVGLAYLTRADGLLLLLALPTSWWIAGRLSGPQADTPSSTAQDVSAAIPSKPRATGSPRLSARVGWPCLVTFLVALAAVVMPWLVRNAQAFGTPFPSSVLDQAWLTDYADTFNYWARPTLQSLHAQGWQAALTQRALAILASGGEFLNLTFPWGILAIPGLWILRKRRPLLRAGVYSALLFFGLALVFPVSSLAGTFYHSLGATVPFLAVAALTALQRALQHAPWGRRVSRPAGLALALALIVLAAAQLVAALPAVGARHQAEKEQFEAAADWLATNTSPMDVVMTTQPYTLNYVSGRPAIALPAGEPPDAAWDAAQRYDAGLLVITQQFGRYPEALYDRPGRRFQLIETVGGNEIYALIPAQEGQAASKAGGPDGLRPARTQRDEQP